MSKTKPTKREKSRNAVLHAQAITLSLHSWRNTEGPTGKRWLHQRLPRLHWKAPSALCACCQTPLEADRQALGLSRS